MVREARTTGMRVIMAHVDEAGIVWNVIRLFVSSQLKQLRSPFVAQFTDYSKSGLTSLSNMIQNKR